jgi:hypothetical protein
MSLVGKVVGRYLRLRLRSYIVFLYSRPQFMWSYATRTNEFRKKFDTKINLKTEKKNAISDRKMVE